MKEVLSKELLDEIVRRLVEGANPEKIVLFIVTFSPVEGTEGSREETSPNSF